MRAEVPSSNVPRFDGHLNTSRRCSAEAVVVIVHNAVHHSGQIPLSVMRTIVRCPLGT
jgi:hypothetical protein